MTSITTKIHAHISALPEGEIVGAQDLEGLGNADEIESALNELLGNQQLLCVAPDQYVAMLHGRFGARGPSTEALVEGWSRKTGHVVVAGGAHCANALRMSTQVPVRPVYWTSGADQQLIMGKLVIHLQNADPWLLHQGIQGDALRAMYSMGQGYASRAAARLFNLLVPEEWKALLALTPQCPTWVGEALASQPSL